ncbi:MAG: hypothetical protein HQ546_03580 [Planctomycetes bacterium]|nr:hypothetical protein [Planctomycetota bacterium]
MDRLRIHRVRVSRVGSDPTRRGRVLRWLGQSSALMTAGALLVGLGLLLLFLAVIIALAPWFILIGAVVVAAGWIKRRLAGKR